MHKLTLLVLTALGSVLGVLVPKDKKIWVFGAWMGKSYSDNPKYLYEYVQQHSSLVTPVWIYKDKSIAESLAEQGVNAYYYKSLRGIYFQLRAKVAFVGHSISSDLNQATISMTTKRVQLWHGMPIKKIGFDDLIYTTNGGFSVKYPRLAALLTNNWYHLFSSIGKQSTDIFSTAFNARKDDIAEIGFPRNDVFLDEQAHELSGKGVFKAIYLPTFRGGEGGEFPLLDSYGMSIEDLDATLKAANILLDVKMHPVNTLPPSVQIKVNAASNIKLVQECELYSILPGYDCLVTDYSSVVFDFALSKKPIVFAAFDYEDYIKNDREFYFDYEELTEGRKCLDWSSVVQRLQEFCAYGHQGRNEFLLSCHSSLRSSSQRTYDEVISRFYRN